MIAVRNLERRVRDNDIDRAFRVRRVYRVDIRSRVAQGLCQEPIS